MSLEKLFRLLDGSPKPDFELDLDTLATKDYVKWIVAGVDWQESVQHAIHYVKETAGAPSGTPATNEKCLNTADAKLYVENGVGAWDEGTDVLENERFVHKDTGTDTSGDSGTHTKSFKIYQYDGSAFVEFAPTKGAATWIEDLGGLWIFNDVEWVKIGSTVPHNNLDELQGGTEDERYHLTENQEGGIAAATAITADNPPLTHADRSTVPVPVKFVYFGPLAAAQSDVEAEEPHGVLSRVVMPLPGSIVAHGIQSNSPVVAGTIIAEPTISGTKATENGLDLTLDSSTNPSKNYANMAPNTSGLTFVAGAEIGVMLTTDTDWDNDDGDIETTLYVVFNPAS